MQSQHVEQIVSEVLRVVDSAAQAKLQRYEYAKRLVQCKQLSHQDYEQALRKIADRIEV